MAKKGKKKRKRVSAEDVRKDARKGGKGGNWFNLPKNVRQWKPDEVGKYLIDILPYEITDDNHPDEREKESIWYKRPFAVHHNVGAMQQSVVCLSTFGKKCPICEDRRKYEKKDSEKYEDIIKSLYPQKHMVFNITDPDDEDRIALFVMSIGKFYVKLKEEIDEGDVDIALFFDVVDGHGKTLKVRWSKKTHQGRPFLAATKIDFKDRDDMDEDEILEKVVNLDECFKLMSYDKLKSLYFQTEEENEEDDDEDDEEEEAEEVTTEVDEDDEDDDDDDEDESEDEDEDEEEDSDSEDDEDDSEDEDDDEDDEEVKKTKPKTKPKSKVKPKTKAKPKTKPKAKGKGKKDTKKKGKGKCPHGHKFGKDLDDHKECEKCDKDTWNACEDAS